jgi:hypothetical protein
MVTVGPPIGRESELAQLEGMLACTRLLTVTGAGGCGKTRLVLELADRVSSREYGPECVIALLSSVASEEQLVEALPAAVGARERFGSRPTEVLLERVAGRRLLLILDALLEMDMAHSPALPSRARRRPSPACRRDHRGQGVKCRNLMSALMPGDAVSVDDRPLI